LFLVVASVVKCKYKFNGGEKGNALHPETGAKKRGEQGVGVKYLFVAEQNFMLHTFMGRCSRSNTMWHKSPGPRKMVARRIKPSAAIQVEKFKPTFPARKWGFSPPSPR